MIELFGSALVTFLVIIDPPGCAPIFAGLTSEASPAHRRRIDIWASLIDCGNRVVFGFLVLPMLHAVSGSLVTVRVDGSVKRVIDAAAMTVRRRQARPG